VLYTGTTNGCPTFEAARTSCFETVTHSFYLSQFARRQKYREFSTN
jgi:hypothetical protein